MTLLSASGFLCNTRRHPNLNPPSVRTHTQHTNTFLYGRWRAYGYGGTQRYGLVRKLVRIPKATHMIRHMIRHMMRCQLKLPLGVDCLQCESAVSSYTMVTTLWLIGPLLATIVQLKCSAYKL